MRDRFHKLADELGYPFEVKVNILMECIKQVGNGDENKLYKLCLKKITDPAYKLALEIYKKS